MAFQPANPHHVIAVRERLSIERLAPYDALAGGDATASLQLYEWNTALWTPALRHAFPNLTPQRRRDIAEPVERLHRLRNRIAHHEPIHRRDLAATTPTPRPSSAPSARTPRPGYSASAACRAS